MSCDLCKREVCTTFYYEDDDFWIVECKTCKVPMIVLKYHRVFSMEEEEVEMKRIVRQLFNNYTYNIDSDMKSIPEHKHWHLRNFKRKKNGKKD